MTAFTLHIDAATLAATQDACRAAITAHILRQDAAYRQRLPTRLPVWQRRVLITCGIGLICCGVLLLLSCLIPPHTPTPLRYRLGIALGIGGGIAALFLARHLRLRATGGGAERVITALARYSGRKAAARIFAAVPQPPFTAAYTLDGRHIRYTRDGHPVWQRELPPGAHYLAGDGFVLIYPHARACRPAVFLFADDARQPLLVRHLGQAGLSRCEPYSRFKQK